MKTVKCLKSVLIIDNQSNVRINFIQFRHRYLAINDPSATII